MKKNLLTLVLALTFIFPSFAAAQTATKANSPARRAAETITAAQALAITAADTLIVGTGAANAVTVIYNSVSDTIAITMGVRSVTFAPAVATVAQNGHVIMADGAQLYIGYTAGEDIARGMGIKEKRKYRRAAQHRRRD